MVSREGSHERVGLVWLEAEIRTRLIRLASSVADEAFIGGNRAGDNGEASSAAML